MVLERRSSTRGTGNVQCPVTGEEFGGSEDAEGGAQPCPRCWEPPAEKRLPLCEIEAL